MIQKPMFILASILIAASIILYQPLLSLIAQQRTLHYASQIPQRYGTELRNRLEHLQKLVDTTSASMINCNESQLLLNEYQHNEMRLIGYQSLTSKESCWSQKSIIEKFDVRATLSQSHSLSNTSGLHVLTVFNQHAWVYYRVVQNRRWLVVLEQIELTDSICHHCYKIDWSRQLNAAVDETHHHFENDQQEKELIYTIIYDFPALFYIYTDGIYAKYIRLTQPWLMVILFIITISILMFYAYYSFSKRKMKVKLSKAIRKHQMKPFYQPIIDSLTGKVVAVEVLARWQVKDQIIPASEFIEYAENSGLIDPLLLSLVDQTVAARKSYLHLLKHIDFSFNLTPKQLERPDFVHKFYNICNKIHSQDYPIALEITEREPFQNLDSAKEILKKFTDLGLTIKLDDTGTGYGSFSYIQNLGFQVIKIDKMFIDTIETNNVKRTVLDAIIEFGHTAQLDIIAEGVETNEQADYLDAHKVTIHQGFLYAKPINFNELIQFIRHRNHLKESPETPSLPHNKSGLTNA